MRGDRSILLERLLSRSQDVLGWQSYVTPPLCSPSTQTEAWPPQLAAEVVSSKPSCLIQLEDFSRVSDANELEDSSSPVLDTIWTGVTAATNNPIKTWR